MVLLVLALLAELLRDTEAVDLVAEVAVGRQAGTDANDLGLEALARQLLEDGCVLLGTDVAEDQQDLRGVRCHERLLSRFDSKNSHDEVHRVSIIA